MTRRALLALLLTAGCRAPSPPARPVLSLGPSPMLENGCESDAFSLPFAALKENPLTAASFMNVPALAAPLCSPFVQDGLSHLIQCALPEGAEVRLTTLDGKELVYLGKMGLAPEWASGPCDVDCQEWVSACMYATRNYYPVHVLVWFSAEKIAVTPGKELFPIEEGAFFGNFFQGYRTGYACRGKNHDPLAAVWRRCAQPGSDCGDILAIGPCSSEDGLAGTLTANFACEGKNPDGSYHDCHTKVSNSDGTFDAASLRFRHAITINLQRPNLNPVCP